MDVNHEEGLKRVAALEASIADVRQRLAFVEDWSNIENAWSDDHGNFNKRISAVEAALQRARPVSPVACNRVLLLLNRCMAMEVKAAALRWLRCVLWSSDNETKKEWKARQKKKKELEKQREVEDVQMRRVMVPQRYKPPPTPMQAPYKNTNSDWNVMRKNKARKSKTWPEP